MKDVNERLDSIHEKINEGNERAAEEGKARELLEQAFGSYVKRMDSKVENCQTVSQLMLDLGKKNKERINGMATAIGEAHGFSAQALNKSNDTEKAFNRLWLRIFFSIVVSILLSQAGVFMAFLAFAK